MTTTDPAGSTRVPIYTCRVCWRDYDETLEKCPTCAAWRGDNKVMAEPPAKPARPQKSEPVAAKPAKTAEDVAAAKANAKAAAQNVPPTAESASTSSLRAPSSSAVFGNYAAIFLAWLIIGVGVVLLVRDSHLVGGICLVAGGVVNWHWGVHEWGGDLPSAVPLLCLLGWILGIPLAGAWMLTNGHVVSGVVDLGVVGGPVLLLLGSLDP